jgi:hypothetical protein
MEFKSEAESAASRKRLEAMKSVLARAEDHANDVFKDAVNEAHGGNREQLLAAKESIIKALTKAYVLGMATGTSMAADAVQAVARGQQ